MIKQSGISIKFKLFVLLLILIIPLIYFVQDKVRSEIKSEELLNSITHDVGDINTLSGLLHEFQRERGLTGAFLYSTDSTNRRVLRNTLLKQQSETDKFINKIVQEAGNQQIKIVLVSRLSQLSTIREAIINFNISHDNVTEYYVQLAEHLTEEINRHLKVIPDAEITQLLISDLYLLKSKEGLGRTRLSLNKALAAGEMSHNDHNNLIKRYEMHLLYLDEFKKKAPNEVVRYLERQLAADSMRNVFATIEKVCVSGEIAHADVGLLQWHNSISDVIDRLRECEKVLLADITEKANQKIAKVAQRVYIYSIATFLLLLLSGGLSVFITNRISRSVALLKDGAEKIADGDTEIDVHVKSSGELRVLADAFNRLASNTREISRVAEAIGKGDYNSEVPIRGTKDMLGHSISTMKANLSRFAAENDERNFLLSSSVAIGDEMRKSEDLKELAEKTITSIALHTNAIAGAIYLQNKANVLELEATFGAHAENIRQKTINPGEGLAGQAMRLEKCVTISDKEQKRLSVKTTFAEVSAEYLLAYPFRFGGKLLAVAELGSLRPFSELHLKLLDEINEKIAMTFQQAYARRSLKELLRKTQEQAEELATQQEELRAANEELIDSSNELRTSEEELRSQQEELQEKARLLEEKNSQLMQINNELESAKEELVKKAELLETTSRYKSEFLANMSHELRTPLNSILILANLLIEKRNLTIDKQTEFAGIILKSANDLLLLINEVLDLAKIESGNVTISSEPFDVAELGLSELFDPVAKSRNIQFFISMNENVNPILHSDKTRLGQILKNLLSNAFKFTPGGGRVTLDISYANEGVQFFNFDLHNYPNVLAFSVSDNGIGIDENKLETIFEAFRQADSSTSRKYGGTGLGLSISKELASLLGGEIHVKSEKGKGSCFTLYIPARISSNETGSYGNANRRYEPTGNQNSIFPDGTIALPAAINEDQVVLIVCSDEILSQELLSLISESNYKAITISDHSHALEYANRLRPVAVLIDMGESDNSAINFLTAMQNSEELSQIPLYIISEKKKSEFIAASGNLAYIEKPLSAESLERIFKFSESTERNVLIVEDDADHALSVASLLETRKIKCIIAKSVQEAEGILSEQEFNCIILDLELHDGKGVQLLERLHRLLNLTNTHCIIYTGKQISEEEERKLRRYAQSVILKTSVSGQRLLDEITLFLNSVKSTPFSQESEIESKTNALRGKKVLLVDDDIRNVYALHNVLDGSEMQVVVAGDGSEAIKKLEAHPDTDIILMDIMMPVMDGYETITAIRKSEQFKHLPIIALTAKAMPGDKAKCIEAGASDYLPKPIDTRKLITLMRVLLY